MDRHLYELSKEEMQEKIKILIGNLSIRNQLKVITENIFEKKNTQEIMEFLDINGNILLYGKPGTGKTSMCYECMLNYERASCYHLNISTLISEKMGKTAKLVGNFFEDIIEKAKKYRVFLLVEEIETFLPDRSSSKELEDMKRALTVFMHYLDKKIPNLVVLCTTNHKSNLDDAITRRFAFQYEITNNEKESFIQFLTFEANPFKDDFIDSSINHEIAEILVDNECTFSDLKHFMRELFISGNEVTSKNLLQQIKEATYEQ